MIPFWKNKADFAPFVEDEIVAIAVADVCQSITIIVPERYVAYFVLPVITGKSVV